MSKRPGQTTRVVAIGSFTLAALLAACDVSQPAAEFGAPTLAGTEAAVISPPIPDPALVCTGSYAHDTHVALMTCQTCHPCAGVTGFQSPVTLPRGTTTAGGTVTPSTGDPSTGNYSPATCSVGCHNVSGSSSGPVAWNGGTLMCSSCHSATGPSGAVSSHPVDTSTLEANRASCQGCHELGQHLSGQVRIDVGETVIPVNGTQPELTNPACQGCHDGDGAALATKTPPLLVGWTDTAADFHGTRAGTGYGGTLLAPYARGQAPIGCVACHDAHGSTSAYLFRANVNGTPLSSAVTRAGVGAEALCSGCHSGARHQACIDCHEGNHVCNPSDGIMDPPSARLCQGGVAVDPAPAGSACFFCHGHEGIVNFPPAIFQPGHPNGQGNCTHCHWRDSGIWYPALELAKPTLQGVVTADVGLETATITWTTNEPTTTFLEYGVGTRSRITGDRVLRNSHQVTLTGLTRNTPYVYRLRSADRFRNLMDATELTFTTLGSLEAPPPPVTVPIDYLWADEDWYARVTFQWSASIDPQGEPVQYLVQIDEDPAFGSPLESGWITATSFYAVLPAEGYYYWHVKARDTTGHESPWSTADQFFVQGWYE